MDFGQRLIELRDDRGIGRRKLNELTGLSLSYLHEIENGTWLPSHEKLNLIADALKLKRAERAELLRQRDEADLKRQGFADADVTLLMKEHGPLDDRARRQILRALSEGRSRSNN